MTDFSLSRKNMVDCQIHTAGIIDEALLSSFQSVPRELFVAEKNKSVSYMDDYISLGQGRFLLEPMVLARMLQSALPNKDDVVLDIASATGYTPALLSPIVTTIIALEKSKRHIEKAARLFEKLSICNVVQVEGEISEGAAQSAPYSLIIINGAVAEIPQAILDQLAPLGRLVTVLKSGAQAVGHAVLVKKDHQGHTSQRVLFETGTPLLPEFLPKPSFQF